MLKQGYRPGRGLGKNLQGITEPVKALESKNRQGLGYTLPENDIFKIQLEYENQIQRSQYYQERLKINCTIPPRTETIMKVSIREKGVRVCKAKEIEKGVYIANSICQSEEGYGWVGVLNSTKDTVEIKNVHIDTDPIFYYQNNVTKPKIQSTSKTLRFNKLKENLILEDTLTEKEKATLEDICREFKDVFHLPEDELTHTTVAKFRLPLLHNAGIVNVKQYRLPEAHKKEAQNQITKMLEDGIIEPSFSPYNSYTKKRKR